VNHRQVKGAKVPFGHNLDGPTVAHHIRLHHWRQIDDAYARKLLTYRHQLVASDLSAGFSADYGYVLAVYWRYAPLFALQQLLVVVIVWVHGAIGLYSTLVLRRSWPRLAPIVVPILFAIPILALLGFAHAGEAVLARLATDTAWRALIEQNCKAG
jgi:hypothetical protein